MRRTTVQLISGLALVGALTACGSTQVGEPVAVSGSGQQTAPTTGAAGGGGGVATPASSLDAMAAKAADAMAAKKTARISVSGSGPGADAIGGSGLIRFDGDNFAMSMTSKVPAEPGQPAQETKMIVIGDNMYVEAPKDMPVEPGKKWLKIDPNGTDMMSKLFGAMVKQSRQSSDPKTMFKTFTDAGTLSGSTTETLGGVSAVKYKIAVDLKKMAEKATDPMTKLGFEMLLKNGVTTMNYDMWTDAAGLPMQFQFSQQIPGAPAEMTITAKYSGWGEPVDIKAPADSEIAPPMTIPPR